MSHKLPYISASRLTTAEQCLRLYHQRYVAKRPTAGAAPQLEFGTVNHDTLEDAAKGVIRTHYSGRLPVERLVALYERKFAASTLCGLEWFADGQEIMKTWAERMGHVEHGMIVGVELTFRQPLELPDGSNINLFGYIDRVDRLGEGHYRVVDYKTSRSVPSQRDLDEHIQLGMYDLAVRALYPDAHRVDLELDMLRHGITVSTTRNDAQRAALRSYVAMMVVKLQQLQQWPAKVNRFCSWCNYRGECDEFQRVLGDFVAYEVKVDDLEAVASERERAALTAKLAKARVTELDAHIKAAAESGTDGAVELNGRRYSLAQRRSITYDVPHTIVAVGAALGLPIDAVMAKVAKVEKGKLTAALKPLEKAERMLVTADIEAHGKKRTTTYLRSEEA